MHRVVLFLILLLAATGCSRPPAPLGLQEIPAAFEKAFKNAKEETRFVVQGILKQVERQQFGPASFQLQNMLSDRSLTPDQRTLVARALITINSNLQKQAQMQEAAIAAPPTQSQPRRAATPQLADPTAAPNEQAAAEAKATLELYRRTK